MRFAAPYSINAAKEHGVIVDEYNIDFKYGENDFNALLDFVEEFCDKRVNISFDEIIAKDLKILKSFSENIVIRISNEQQLSYINDIKKLKMKFMLGENLKIFSYNLLEWAAQLGASGIYISDDLCYDMDNVKKYCMTYDMEIRLVANRVPSISIIQGALPTSLIFSPKDAADIAKYFDVIEFDCFEKNTYRWDICEILYRRWFVTCSWDDDIELINPDVRFFIPNGSMPRGAAKKLNCKHRCVSKNSLCSDCYRNYDLGNILSEEGMIFND